MSIQKAAEEITLLHAEIDRLRTERWAAFSERELDFIEDWLRYGMGSRSTADSWKIKLIDDLQRARNAVSLSNGEAAKDE